MRQLPRCFQVALGVTLAIGGVRTLAAQNNASATISATVQQPITVTKNNDLSFGSVFPGVDKVIGVSAGGAAKFTLAGQASTPVNLTFTLPSAITSGANNLAVGSWTGQ